MVPPPILTTFSFKVFNRLLFSYKLDAKFKFILIHVDTFNMTNENTCITINNIK